MKLHFDVTSETRKAMVRAIEKETGLKAKYLGMPSAAYQIGAYRVERDGTLSWGEVDILERLKVTEACIEATGSTPPETEVVEAPTEATPEQVEESKDDTIELNIEVPADKVDTLNLKALLTAKESLIKKALGVQDLSFETTEEKVSFPWFKDIQKEEVLPYTKFISALCEMSVNQKRVTAKPKENENEKYAFRCFLLRLGFIGDEYKADRKVLLKNLEGSSAFKSGKRGGEQ